ncbi:MAG: 2-oxo acid dehydrogenase subunit E2 [Deltaproteobacteria bacterium]|nr:MAG: 2-oxo acid dehydrogenase subunit E2 [Deltaproteobacteria bacterium]
MMEFALPAIGEGVVEGEIVRWMKQPGERVAKNEPLVEVMTDKATVEIPAPEDAVVVEHRAAEGDICAIGQVIAILEPGAAAAAASPAAASAAAPEPATPAASETSASSTEILATPAARARAREAGIDLASIPGDDRGRITRDHVEAALAGGTAAAQQRVTPAPAAPAPAPAAPAPTPAPTAPAPAPAPRAAATDEADEYIPFRGLRRKIAEGMVRSYTSAVHYTYVEQVNVSRLVALREEAKKAAAESGVKLTYLPFITKAVIHALRKYPIVNAYLDEANQRIVLRKRYHIGIATATKNGLVVPVVHDADRLSLLDLAREIARVSDAARAGTAKLEELTGSTFTITSLGQIGGVLATPILNYPEVGILGVHAIRKVPMVDENDRIVVGHLMNLSVSLDHRIVDGYEGASFLQEVRRYLEDPNLLLLSSI